MTDAIVAEGLRKRYGDKAALDGLDLTVARGTVHGVLGPNGAGKTTAVRILTTLLRPDEGRAEVAGHDVVRQAYDVRLRIGLLGQHAALDEELSGRQNLDLFGRLHHLGARHARVRADELLERFGLTDAAWTSRPPSLPNRRSSSWTNPPPASTRAAGPRCGPRSAPSSAAVRRSC
jgi:ABC-2 type transport system ATP-binding protein